MTFAQAKARHAKLADEIGRHDHAYYVEGRQLITDREYDQLFGELQKLEKDFPELVTQDRKSTRLNSSHQIISYAVFCLKKKKKKIKKKTTNNKNNKNNIVNYPTMALMTINHSCVQTFELLH